MSELGAIALDAVARRQGTSAEVTLTARIPSGTHIESHAPTEPNLIPTVVEVDGLEAAAVEYPEPVITDLGIPGAELSVYEGTVRFVIRGEAAPDAEAVRGAVSYQPCVGGACLPPRGVIWKAELSNTKGDRNGNRDSRR